MRAIPRSLYPAAAGAPVALVSALLLVSCLTGDPRWGVWGVLFAAAVFFSGAMGRKELPPEPASLPAVQGVLFCGWGAVGIFCSRALFRDQVLTEFSPLFWPRAGGAFLLFAGVFMLRRALARKRSVDAGWPVPLFQFLFLLPLLAFGRTLNEDLGESARWINLFLFLCGCGFCLWILVEAVLACGHGRRRRNHVTMAVILFLMLPFFTAFTLPQLGRVSERARRVACLSNLKQIRLALEQYAEDSEGELPPGLEALENSGILTDRAIYRCPSCSAPSRGQGGFDSDYLYTVENGVAALRDRPGNHYGGFANRIEYSRREQ